MPRCWFVEARSARAVVLITVAACAAPAPETDASHAALGGAAAVSVGSVRIPTLLVRDVAARGHTAPQRAATALASDTQASLEAERRGWSERADVRTALRASLAARVVARLVEEARAKGGATQAEVDELSRLHSRELDTWRVVHAVVLRPEAGAFGPLIALAERIHDAAVGSPSPQEFQRRARAVAAGGDVVVEELPAFDAAGRAADGSTFDSAFTRAATSLSAVGAVSEVSESPYGWHVIYLISQPVPASARAELFSDEVVSLRAKAALSELRARLRRATPVGLSTGLAPLTDPLFAGDSHP